MLHNDNVSGQAYENVFLINDVFDSYIEYIALAKELLDRSANKRVVLFNYPGQSHTIYKANTPFTSAQFNSVLEKLMFRLSGEKNQMGVIDIRKDTFKFIGIGYGGYLTASFLANNTILHEMTAAVLLVNSFK